MLGLLARRVTPSLCLWAALTCSACGVAGRPISPGPIPPAAPSSVRVVHSPDGWEVSVEDAAWVDVDGLRLEQVPDVWAFVDHPPCRFAPDVRGPADRPIQIARGERTRAVLWVALSRDGRVGRAKGPISVVWSAPPPAPEAPLVFATTAGRVELSWLPPPPPIDQIRVLRDGQPVALRPAGEAMFTDHAVPAGRHRYAIEGIGPGIRTAPSPPTGVTVVARSP